MKSKTTIGTGDWKAYPASSGEGPGPGEKSRSMGNNISPGANEIAQSRLEEGGRLIKAALKARPGTRRKSLE